MLSHCGVDAWRPPDIPFGVRAIQNGVEVEGIWISRPNTPEKSQPASSPTLSTTTALAGDRSHTSKGKERMVDSPPASQVDVLGSAVPDSYSGTQSFEQNSSNSGLQNSASLHDVVSREGFRDKKTSSDNSHMSSLRNPFGTPSHTTASYVSKEPSTASSDADPSLSESAFYRNAEIIINRNTRRGHRQCAVIPSGPWRSNMRHSSDGIGVRSSVSQQPFADLSGAKKLRKLPNSRNEKARSQSLDSCRI